MSQSKLLTEEEDRLAEYLIKMCDMGFGLTKEGVMGMTFSNVNKSQRLHPFKNGSAGRAWFEGFVRRHPQLTIRSPQPLSYSRAVCANQDTISDFFGKLGAIYGKLNLVSKPMQIYNCDETGVTIVFRPPKVVAEIGCRNVYAEMCMQFLQLRGGKRIQFYHAFLPVVFLYHQ